MTDVRRIAIEQIRRRPQARRRTEKALAELEQSLAVNGLLQPIVVRPVSEGKFEVVAGAHRLQACDLLGWPEITATVLDLDDLHAEMAMIAENLHRTELTKLERDVQVARWIELVEQKARQEVSSQLAKKPQGGRPKGGVNAAARELCVGKDDVYRAIKVASLSPEAKAAARETGLDDNRSALLAAAKQSTPGAQVEAILQRAQGGLASRYQAGEAAVVAPVAVDFDELERLLIKGCEWLLAADIAGVVKSLEGKGNRRITVLQRIASVVARLDSIVEGVNR